MFRSMGITAAERECVDFVGHSDLCEYVSDARDMEAIGRSQYKNTNIKTLNQIYDIFPCIAHILNEPLFSSLWVFPCVLYSDGVS